jgi:hypothetical protein
MDRKFVAALSTYGEQLERIAELEQENERLLQENEQLHLTIDGIMKLLGG